jgi:hypothetical protein
VTERTAASPSLLPPTGNLGAHRRDVRRCTAVSPDDPSNGCRVRTCGKGIFQPERIATRDDLSDACEAPGLNPMLKEVDRWDWLVRWLEQHGQRNKEIACGVHPRLQRFGWAMQCGPNDVELLQCRQDRRPTCRGSCGCPNNRLQGALHDRGEPGRRRPRHLQCYPRESRLVRYAARNENLAHVAA